MRIIEISAQDNRAHRNQTGTFFTVPDGWAIIPDDMVCENFPFGEIEVKEIDGIMTVIKWIPGEIPAEPTLSPSELREQAYSTEPIINWEDDLLTVDEANDLFNKYFAEASEKANQLQLLIIEAKTSIREKYPD